MLGVISAIGGCVQVVKTLYEYYDLHVHNKALADILEGFSANLETAIARLQVREQLLVGSENPALESIQKDFFNAQRWLLANDKNLRGFWTTLQASDKLKDLDNRLTKAFASKIAIAIFSALQDTRAGVNKVQTTLDGMATNLEVACRNATREGLQEAIRELKEEAYCARLGGGGGSAGGFRTGEAEKIISSLVDRLAEQDRLKEEEQDDDVPMSYTLPVSRTSVSNSAPAYVSQRTAIARSLSETSASRPTTSGGSSSSSLRDPSLFSQTGPRRASSTLTVSTSVSATGLVQHLDRVPEGSIVVEAIDPLDGRNLIDPVLANDGLIHDRWTLVEADYTGFRDPRKPLMILGDIVQLREAVHSRFPERRQACLMKRQAYRDDTIRLYLNTTFTALPDLLNRLSHVLLYEPDNISILVRRGYVNYRLRHLADAEHDFDKALKMSQASEGYDCADGLTAFPNLDALRGRALVRHEMHNDEFMGQDLTTLLSHSPKDILGLSLRAIDRANNGELKSAQEDLATTNEINAANGAWRSPLGDGDCDLEYLMRGWAYVALLDFSSAARDFSYSLSLRHEPEPYTLACRGFAQAHLDMRAGASPSPTAWSDFEASMEVSRAFASSLRAQSHSQVPTLPNSGTWSSGAKVPRLFVGVEADKPENGERFSSTALPVAAYGPLFLRGTIKMITHDFEAALQDYELALKLRPGEVNDTGPFRAALAELRAQTGDRQGAAKDYDHAIALDPRQRFVYTKAREEHGVCLTAPIVAPSHLIM